MSAGCLAFLAFFVKNMKTILFKISPAFLVIYFFVPILANAASSDTGILPDSPFYFIEQIKENIDLIFTFNPETKIQKVLSYADKRLAEAKKMVQAGKTNVAKKAMANYEEEINLSKKILERVKDDQKKDEILKRIEEKIAKDRKSSQLISDESKSGTNKNDLDSKITVEKNIQETETPKPSPTKSLKPVETKKPNETPTVIEKQNQKQKETRPSTCNYVYEEGVSMYLYCERYYSDAEKIAAKKLKQEKEYLRFCNGTYYSAEGCLSSGTFNCPPLGTPVCCVNGAAYCNGKCWSLNCPEGTSFHCPEKEGSAECVTYEIEKPKNDSKNNKEASLSGIAGLVEEVNKNIILKKSECQIEVDRRMKDAEDYKNSHPIIAEGGEDINWAFVLNEKTLERKLALVELTRLQNLALRKNIAACYTADNYKEQRSSGEYLYEISPSSNGGYQIKNLNDFWDSYDAIPNSLGGFTIKRSY